MKKAKENLVGKKFGRLTVIEDDGTKEYGCIKYLCRCECGNLKHISEYSLKNSKSNSCGCLHKEFLKKQKANVIGKRFGKLVVVGDSGERRKKAVLYQCICDCGNQTTAVAYSLKSGKKQSCGCLKAELSKNRIAENIGFVENTTLTGIASKNLRSDNTSGVTGVCWDKKQSKWCAQIGFKGKVIRLGNFVNKQDAINARKEAEEKYFEPILEKYK